MEKQKKFLRKNENVQKLKEPILILGECTQELKKLKPESVDLVFTDPPYNTANKNTKQLKGRKSLSNDFGEWDYFEDDKFLIFSDRWIKRAVKILKQSGNFLVFCKLEYISDIKRIYEKYGLKHHGTIIWHKTNPAPKIRKTGFLSSCEAILWATKGFDDNKVPYTFNFKTQKEMHNFFETPICMGYERSNHPTQKPKKLIKHFLEIFANPNDTILDCFAGSGTLAEAAKELGMLSINIENNKQFFDIIKKRLKEKIGEKNNRRLY